MGHELSASARRVQAALRGFGLPLEVVELPDSTRTAAEAAQAVGCAVGQIAKSLVFRAQESGKPILVIASGANRVDEARLAHLLGEPMAKADAAFVREHTGFAIGGVPPVGHPHALSTYIDDDLFRYSEIWAAAGTPHAVFRLSPTDLLRITRGKPAIIAAPAAASA
jgi:prolyl-tRNA editing enzyme YbaK/EbsC (Cys-tRNA(Pro) deacylase)